MNISFTFNSSILTIPNIDLIQFPHIYYEKIAGFDYIQGIKKYDQLIFKVKEIDDLISSFIEMMMHIIPNHHLKCILFDDNNYVNIDCFLTSISQNQLGFYVNNVVVI